VKVTIFFVIFRGFLGLVCWFCVILSVKIGH
jgi:hypothetical protein